MAGRIVDKRKLLIQLDSDPQPSVFDQVVAYDAGADVVMAYGGVTPKEVREKIHGAIFTRGPKNLHRTALFIGGSNVALGEQLLAEACKHMLPQYGLRVSVLLDSSGANTTAAAAVRSAARHLDLKETRALVLGGTGPVGWRVALLLARQGAEVRVGSREQSRAAEVVASIRAGAGGETGAGRRQSFRRSVRGAGQSNARHYGRRGRRRAAAARRPSGLSDFASDDRPERRAAAWHRGCRRHG